MSTPVPPPPPPEGGGLPPQPGPVPPPGGYPPPSYSPPPPPPGYLPPPPPPGVGGPGYGGGMPPPGVPQSPGNNPMAVASLVLSLLGLCCGIGTILGIILGFVALNQIKSTGQSGAGMAKAGIIIGFVFLALWIIYLIFTVATGNSYYWSYSR